MSSLDSFFREFTPRTFAVPLLCTRPPTAAGLRPLQAAPALAFLSQGGPHVAGHPPVGGAQAFRTGLCVLTGLKPRHAQGLAPECVLIYTSQCLIAGHVAVQSHNYTLNPSITLSCDLVTTPSLP